MDLDVIKNLLDLIAESEVNEVSIEEGDFKIKVKKKPDVEQQSAPQMPVQYQMPAQPQQAPQQQPAQKPAQPAQSGDDTSSEQEDATISCSKSWRGYNKNYDCRL